MIHPGDLASLIGPDPATPLVVSRAASPELRDLLGDAYDVVVAPVYRGRTLWSAVNGRACVETPNWWGRAEPVPQDRDAIVIDRRHDRILRGTIMGDDPTDWADRILVLRRCLRTAAQLAGVRPAHGDPEAPWAVLLLPIAAEAVAEACVRRGLPGVEALAPRVPELPGGLRLEAPSLAGSDWSASVVASIEQATEQSGAT